MLALSRYCLDDPLLKLLEQAEDAVRGDRGDTEEGNPCEHVAQKAGADAAVAVAASKVESRAGNQGQHEGLGDAPGLDQSLGREGSNGLAFLPGNSSRVSRAVTKPGQSQDRVDSSNLGVPSPWSTVSHRSPGEVSPP